MNKFVSAITHSAIWLHARFRYLLVLFVVAGLFFILSSGVALAIECGLNAVCHFTAAIATLLESFAQFVWSVADLAARFMSWVLIEFNERIGFVDNPFVQVGWAAVRDVANWFFVIFFLVSAIATVLDLPRYNARAILPKLLIMAVLVNFSLFITGFVVNVANIMMYVFIEQGVNSFGDIGLVLSDAMHSANGRLPSSAEIETIDTVEDGTEQAALLATYAIGSLVLGGFTAFIFGFIGLLLIARVIYLWVTIILSPLAFVLTAFPATQTFFQKWLKRFINQSVFGVISAFFIWLAVYLHVYMRKQLAEGVPTTATTVEQGFLPFLLANMDAFISFATIFVFLYLAMKIAKEMSGEAGQFVFNGMKAALGVAAIAGTGGAALAARGATAGALRMQTAQKAGNLAAKVPGGGRIAERLYRTQRTYDTGRAKRQADRNLDEASDSEIKQLTERAGKGPKVMDRDAEIARQAMNRGIKLEGWSDEKIVAAIKRLDRFGQGKTVSAARPDLAAKAGILKSQKENSSIGADEAIKKHFEKMSSQDFARIHEDAFKSDDVKEAIREGFKAGRLDGRHLGAMARRAQDESSADKAVNQVNQILVNLKPEDFTGRGEQTLKYVNESPIGQQFYEKPGGATRVAGRDMPSAGQGPAPSREKFGKRDSGRVREAKSDNDQST